MDISKSISRKIAALAIWSLLMCNFVSAEVGLVPESTKITGGELEACALPQGLKSLKWKEDAIKLKFRFTINENGETIKVESMGGANKKPWHDPFIKRCLDALENWKFAPIYVNKKKMTAFGFYVDVSAALNKAGEMQIVITDSSMNTIIDTYPGFKE